MSKELIRQQILFYVWENLDTSDKIIDAKSIAKALNISNLNTVHFHLQKEDLAPLLWKHNRKYKSK